MNPLNYGSLEACKRLVDNGIVLETEWQWEPRGFGTYRPRLTADRGGDEIPMPCMAEVWRELPEGTTIAKDNTHSGAFVIGRSKYDHQNTNPTDALIDLLIWVRKEADHDRD